MKKNQKNTKLKILSILLEKPLLHIIYKYQIYDIDYIQNIINCILLKRNCTIKQELRLLKLVFNSNNIQDRQLIYRNILNSCK